MKIVNYFKKSIANYIEQERMSLKLSLMIDPNKKRIKTPITQDQYLLLFALAYLGIQNTDQLFAELEESKDIKRTFDGFKRILNAEKKEL